MDMDEQKSCKTSRERCRRFLQCQGVLYKQGDRNHVVEHELINRGAAASFNLERSSMNMGDRNHVIEHELIERGAVDSLNLERSYINMGDRNHLVEHELIERGAVDSLNLERSSINMGDRNHVVEHELIERGAMDSLNLERSSMNMGDRNHVVEHELIERGAVDSLNLEMSSMNMGDRNHVVEHELIERGAVDSLNLEMSSMNMGDRNHVVEHELIERGAADSFKCERLSADMGEMNSVEEYTLIERGVVQSFGVRRSASDTVAAATNIIVGAHIGGQMTGTLRGRSKSEIEFGTEGLVRTRAFISLIRILQARSRSWTVISGWPGEGKTTLGYFLLSRFLEKKFDVYIIKTKEEYFSIKEFGTDSVVMLNDIFGSLAFELESLNNWLPVLEGLEQIMQRDEGQQFHVIITMRNYVVKAAIPHLGGLASLFQNKKFIIDISEQFPLSMSEKKDILRPHLRQKNVHVAAQTMTKICMLSVNGFPQCCKMFPDITEAHADPLGFFSSPVVFLNQTISKLITNQLVRRLFYLILANNGKVEKRTYEGNHYFESISRDEIIEASHDLIGSYLVDVGGALVFSHPSILWSVVYVVGCRDLEFIIQVCPLSIMKEIVVLSEDTDCDLEAKGSLTITAKGPDVEKLTTRFVKEIEDEYLQTVLSSRAFWCESFAKDVVSRLRKRWPILKLQDFNTRKPFLHFVCSNKSNVLLKVIAEKIISGEHTFSENQLKHLVLGCAENGSRESFVFIREMYPDLDLTVVDEHMRTPLHKASGSGNKGIVELLLPDSDVMAVDANQMTALHCGSEAGHKEVCGYLVEHGGIVDCKDSAGRTPLHFAAWGGHMDVVCFLIGRGADVNMSDIDNGTALHDCCYRGYDGIADTLIKHGSDVNVQNDWGETPNIVAASHGYTDVVRRLLRAGCDTTLRNHRGKTAEDIARKYKYTETVQAFEDYQRRSATDYT